jgi:hypothetical protein
MNSPLNAWVILIKNSSKTAPIENKMDFAKLGHFLVLLTGRS